MCKIKLELWAVWWGRCFKNINWPLTPETQWQVKRFLLLRYDTVLSAIGDRSKNTTIVVARMKRCICRNRSRLDMPPPPRDMMQMFSRIVQHRLFGSAWLVSKKQKINNTWSTQESRRTKRGFLWLCARFFFPSFLCHQINHLQTQNMSRDDLYL